MHMLAEPQNGNGTRPGGGRTAKAPANVECEQNVLAAVMRDNGAMHEVAQVISAEDFFRAAHATIYRAIQTLYDAGKPFDPGLVCEQLERVGEFEAVGGDEYVGRLFDRGGWTAVNAVEYAQVIRRHAIARQLIQAGTETLEEGYSNAHDVEELLAAAERRIFEIAAGQIRSSTSPPGRARERRRWP
jgi:replicative DNA helicase